MMAGLVIVGGAALLFWVVFIKFKWLRLTPGWAFVYGIIFLHLFLIFLIGLRYATPNSQNAIVVQHTIQLIPRLSEPTLVTAVLVEDNTEVKKGQPLFLFDRTVYESKVASLQAQLAAAKENVDVLKANVEAAKGKVAQTTADGDYDRHQLEIYQRLARENSTRMDEVTLWTDKVASAAAELDAVKAQLAAAQDELNSNINGVNTSVANIQAQLQEAQYYLDNTTMVAPEDGRIVNLQVRPGMVSGILRVGGIAALIVDEGRYVLATYYQENLKYVQPGQLALIAFNLYPGQVFKGHVETIWKANGEGQYLPTDEIPKFHPADPNIPQGQYAAKIIIDDPDQSKFPIGAQGAAAILVDGDKGPWTALRKVALYSRTWLVWVYPL